MSQWVCECRYHATGGICTKCGRIKDAVMASREYSHFEKSDCTPHGSFYGEHPFLFCGCALEKAFTAGAYWQFRRTLNPDDATGEK